MENLLTRARKLGHRINECYQCFGVHIHMSKVKVLSNLQRYVYKVELLPGTRVQAIYNYATDVQTALRLSLLYPFRVRADIIIAVSEFDVKENKLLKILRSPKFAHSEMRIPLALGYDLMGDAYITDLSKLLHLLVIGPSGTGKSVALQCIVMSIIVKCPVNSVRLILFDIGANSLALFGTVKHLYHPIVKDTKAGITVLESLVAEMDERISVGEEECQKLPFIVCIIDEFDDTIASIEDKEDEQKFIASINSIIRRGRKAKVILILASHDPTLKNTKVNVNGIIPRIAFKCAKHHNSSTALGVTGAENLPGGGAMLFKSQDESAVVPLQGSFVTPIEIEEILRNEPIGYDNINMLKMKEDVFVELVEPDLNFAEEDKKELADILFWVLNHDTISALQIQKTYKMGNRAAEIVEILCRMNIVTNKFSNQPRKVIPMNINDLSAEIIGLLNHYGYSDEQIISRFQAKGRGELDD